METGPQNEAKREVQKEFGIKKKKPGRRDRKLKLVSALQRSPAYLERSVSATEHVCYVYRQCVVVFLAAAIDLHLLLL